MADNGPYDPEERKRWEQQHPGQSWADEMARRNASGGDSSTVQQGHDFYADNTETGPRGETIKGDYYQTSQGPRSQSDYYQYHNGGGKETEATADKWLQNQFSVTDPYSINANAFQNQGPASASGMYDQASAVNQRQLPQFNFGYQDQTRNAQMGLMQQLQAQANGTGPSLAQLQLQKGQDSAMANAMAMGASQRGANQAGALRNIGTQQAGIQQGLAADSASLRMQEQMMAQQQLAGLTGQMRGQDISAAGQQTQFAQNAKAMNDQMVQFYTSQGMSLQDAQMKASMELEKLRVQQNIEQMKIEQERDAANKKLAGDAVGSVTGMVGGGMSAAAMSDENVKTDIKPADTDLYDFLDKLEAHAYHYKDEEKHGKGERISPMAQELEKSDLGEAFVFDTEDGKAVDYGKGLGTMLAAQAALHRRLKALEEEAADKKHRGE